MQISGTRSRLVAIVALMLAAAMPRWCAAQPDAPATPQKPLWEFGLGLGAIAFMDYAGADTTHLYPVPVPYFVYRGKFLQADRNGLRGRLFNQEWIELNVSLNASAPVRKNAAREGMPDLRPTLEMGPSLDLHLWHSADRKHRFDFRLPVRAAFTIQSPRDIGWVASPHVALDIDDVRDTGWDFSVLTGPLFADRRYNDYYYAVAPAYATQERPAYQAQGGYSGAQILASLSKRYPKHWVGAYVRYESLAGARFEASPLVKQKQYWSGGVGFAWMIAQSSRLVDADE